MPLNKNDPYGMGNSANKLARVMSERIHQGMQDATSARIMDYGVINGDYSLTTNQFGVKIPKDSYSVCRHLVGGPEPDFHWYTQPEEQNSEHSPQSHKHLTYPPRVKPGDRVLVAWIGNDACVIDVVWDAKRL